MPDLAWAGAEADGEEAHDQAVVAHENGHEVQNGYEDEEEAPQEENLPSTLFYGVRGQQVR